ncbi:MAG TPA: L-serine ammonia-lyase, iron-sulfur-dependent subunit beta [Candidatus Limiplasma sp.]|nr:L-serine ammonia-lyase, iron-sulfur-dependent subunit beta [Candidatus Limiplasma sp.]HPS81665.1 L-serine ammonia-lyase, iron-sulfur-dependent subunit beta [Candidatus Limiplasma sp.]
MDMFDIIGPVMIGPSSSHTAGAARIGKIARLLLGGEPVEANIGLWGSFQKTYRGHGTDRALIGGLLGMEVDDVHLRDSQAFARQAGLNVTFYNAKLRNAHPNTVVMEIANAEGRRIRLQAASVGGGEIVIQSVDGLDTDISGHANTLVLTYRDTSGMIARISGQVAESRLNIATMRVSRCAAGGEAMVTLEIDGVADAALIARLSALKDVYHVSYLAARGETVPETLC